MKNRQQGITNRNSGLCSFLGLNAADYTGDEAFEAAVTKMIADTATAVSAGNASAANNTGYSADKVEYKKTASEMAARLCSSCQVKFGMLGNKTLLQALNGNVTFYNSASDALCANRLNNVYGVMETNLVLITATYLTAAQLSTFLGLITTYTTQSGNTTSVNKNQKVLTAQFQTELNVTCADVEVLKLLVKTYKILNPIFYKGVMQACKVLSVAVRHTPLTIDVSIAGTGAPLKNASGSLTRSKEVQKSNNLGAMLFPTVSAGMSIAMIECEGYITGMIDVRIKRGKANSAAIALVAGVTTDEMKAENVARIEAFNVVEDAKRAAKAAKAKARKEAIAAKKKL